MFAAAAVGEPKTTEQGSFQIGTKISTCGLSLTCLAKCEAL